MRVELDSTEVRSNPRPTLSVVDAISMIVGIVVGAGIFKAPSIVAANVGSELAFLLIWPLGGLISLIGALCYAELATAYPHAGGDYHYIVRSFGRDVGLLFAWSRLTVIQTGSIAILAFVFGDYAKELLPLGEYSSSLYAGLAIAVLTLLNATGVKQGKWTQNFLTAAKVLGLLLVFVVGISFIAPVEAKSSVSSLGGFHGLAMIFVLLTYGGWSEAAYISAELRNVRRNMKTALLVSIGIITTVFLLTNLAYLRGLGLEAISQSDALAADLLRRSFGEPGAKFISLLIAVSALGATNGTIFTGARTNYALGRDFPLFSFLGQWDQRANAPVNGLILQAAIALTLVLFGSFTRKGFQTMVEFTAPVFWFFLLLAGLSVFVLRRKEAEVPRPFRVPLYPLTPLLFCLTSVYMLQASLSYTGVGAVVGVAVLLAGLPILFLARRR
jgi:basic amino acid/polyamine antiporter, APA family